MSSTDNSSNPKNIFELFMISAGKYPKKEALRYKIGHHYEYLTFGDLKDEIIRLASALKIIGFKKGDRAIIFSENRPEWVICDLAFAAIGVINIPVHTVLSTPQFIDIINETKPLGLFFSGNNSIEKVAEVLKNTNKIQNIISFERVTSEEVAEIIFFKDLIDDKLSKKYESEIINGAHDILPSDLMSITYTSGATGHPKGVKLTHGNLVSNVIGLVETHDNSFHPTDRLFSVLPLSHIFERTVGYYAPFYCGCSIAYCLDLKNFSSEIKDVEPTIVLAVPRLYEKIYEQIMEKAEKSFFSKNLFRYAVKVRSKNNNRWLIGTFDKLIFDKIKEQFGGRLRFFVSGGAALSTDIATFFENIGFVVLEGYGLTETSPVVACTRLRDYRFGTVGPIIPGVEVSFGRNSEIYVKGPGVFGGYINENDNNSCFVDGWFRTGDIGHLDRGGYLVITGRKKEMIVLTTGKKVIPTAVEEVLESSPYIEQAFVYGEGKKHICALIVPCFAELCKKFGKPEQELTGNKAVDSFITQEVIGMMKDLASYEKVHKFEILSNPFTIDNGELTPTLKLRRHVIYKRYSDLIENLY